MDHKTTPVLPEDAIKDSDSSSPLETSETLLKAQGEISTGDTEGTDIESREIDNQQGTQKRPSSFKPSPSLLKLCEKFPKVFSLRFKKPLKIGIHKDIIERMPDDPELLRNLSKTLTRHVRSSSYQRGLIRYDHRFDLDGGKSGVVTPEQKHAATLFLERNSKPKQEDSNTHVNPLAQKVRFPVSRK